MKDNGGRRPEQILNDIHRTRGELERTLLAIERRLTPGQLVDQSIDYLRQSGASEFAHNLGGAAKQNPLPVTLVGIGLAWLMALGRQPARRERSSTLTSELRDNATGAMQSTSETHSSTRERISGTVSAMRERVSDATDTTRQQWERARNSLDYLVHEQPLALGAIGVAIGAMLGAAAPRTRVEEQMMGRASRNLGEKARQMGSEQLDNAKQAIKEVTQPAQPQSTVPPPQVESTPPVRVEPPDKGSW